MSLYVLDRERLLRRSINERKRLTRENKNLRRVLTETRAGEQAALIREQHKEDLICLLSGELEAADRRSRWMHPSQVDEGPVAT